MRRAVIKATNSFQKLCAAQIAQIDPYTNGGSGPANERDTVVNLVNAVRESDAKVHVDLNAKMPLVVLAGLATKCYPETEPTDHLATLVERAKKKSIRAPFPFVELRRFLPDWAKVGLWPYSGYILLSAQRGAGCQPGGNR